jgi:hypothetical protein
MNLEYFELQVDFAFIVQNCLGISFEKALMEFTAFYRRTGNPDWKWDYRSQKWSSFIENTRVKENYAEVAYKMSTENELKRDKEKRYFGCFRYDYKDKIVRIHFRNNEISGSPLSDENQYKRENELTEMFEEIQRKYPEAKTVNGGTWLYNYSSYKRLFPTEFIVGYQIEKPNFPRSNGIWGQFISSRGGLNTKRVSEFLAKAEIAKNEEEIFEAFPFSIIKTECDIEHFYKGFSIPRNK